MKSVIIVLALVASNIAFAGEVKPAAAQQKGINEAVTIQSLGSNWGYTYTLTGFYSGTGVINVVPVTREAAQVLQSLNKQSRYNCVIQNSTFVAEKMETQTVGGTFFVLDINCN